MVKKLGGLFQGSNPSLVICQLLVSLFQAHHLAKRSGQEVSVGYLGLVRTSDFPATTAGTFGAVAVVALY